MKNSLNVVVMSLLLTGCCMKVQNRGAASMEEQEAWSDFQWCGIFSGYGTAKEPDRFEAVYTPVSADEYGQILCEGVDIEDHATCMNRVRDSIGGTQGDMVQPGNSTSGPFAVVLPDDLYIGTYRSDPFSASFRVSNDRNTCKGSYNAVLGATEPVFRVRCDNGERGTARMVRDRSGRNGIGMVTMDDGTEGKIVFGPAVERAARESL